MKKVYIVSKTHLDLGFTDYAENIKSKYLNCYFKHSIKVAERLNSDEKKRFIWTTGSWIIKEALHNSDTENLVRDALKKGYIAPHAMPFTTHSELLDKDTLDYGLSIVNEIDKITGVKTIAAKMTDVPGHTIGLVPIFAKHGIKLLHIGVNGASALAKVPPCFLWKYQDSEVVVIYSGDYGGEFKSEFIEDILYFNHTLDNRGADSVKKEIKKFKSIEKKYLGYEVAAGRMDEIAEKLWSVKDKLPVVSCEIGDTWIHGATTDPYKAGAMRELIRLKKSWLECGSLNRESEEYKNLADNILCIAEHTWGMDNKIYFADYENYLRKDFEKAREKNKVRMRHIFRGFPQNFIVFTSRLTGSYKKGSYRTIEESWTEQRNYLDKAICGLSDEHKCEAQKALAKLLPRDLTGPYGEKAEVGKEYILGNCKIKFNAFGGLELLEIAGNPCIQANGKPVIDYISYGVCDYDFWIKNYTRNYPSTASWALGDFSRPLLKYADKKYKQGKFAYKFSYGTVFRNEKELRLNLFLEAEDYCHTELGAPKKVGIEYIIKEDKIKIKTVWIDKPANRLTESLNMHFYPIGKALEYIKLDVKINPYEVVENGGRNLSCVEKINIVKEKNIFTIKNIHCPLVGLGQGKILRFDNKFEDFEKEGIAFILHNNVWGTNFPLWYENNAYFEFEMSSVSSLELIRQ